MTVQEKILLIIAYQLSGRKDNRDRRICPTCCMIGQHVTGCEVGEMEDWIRGQLLALWLGEVKIRRTNGNS